MDEISGQNGIFIDLNVNNTKKVVVEKVMNGIVLQIKLLVIKMVNNITKKEKLKHRQINFKVINLNTGAIEKN